MTMADLLRPMSPRERNETILLLSEQGVALQEMAVVLKVTVARIQQRIDAAIRLRKNGVPDDNGSS